MDNAESPDKGNIDGSLSYCTSEITQFYKAQLIRNRIENKLQSFSKNVQVINTKDKDAWAGVLNEFKDHIFISFYERSGTVFDKDMKSFFAFTEYDNTAEFYTFGDKDWVEHVEKTVKKYFEEYIDYVKWYYNEKGEYIDVPLYKNKLPISEMYPFLDGEQLKNYYKRYIESDSSVLLLIGPPGTGKTTFIKGLINYSQSVAYLSYNPAILADDGIFANFMASDARFFVVEDSDNFIKSREEGNNMMHRFLNVSDGLVTTKGKKIIFSTNLESTTNVDAALLRAGRCFDVLEFNFLTKKQAQTLADAAGIELYHDKDEYTIADVFVKDVPGCMKEKKVGFI